jgi:ABC-type bacteriocin/lantibiotic exporter with double-glycine peptidase domain
MASIGLSLIGLLFASAPVGTSQGGVGSRQDLYCGLRCVEAILRMLSVDGGTKYYDEGQLHELVRELSPRESSPGVAIEAVKSSLTKRGLLCRIIEIPPNSILLVRTPTIVHWTTADVPRTLGHFVVLLPAATENECVYWDGFRGTVHESWREFSAKMSGTAMIVGRTEADLNEVEALSITWQGVYSTGLRLASTVLPISILLLILYRRRSRARLTVQA